MNKAFQKLLSEILTWEHWLQRQSRGQSRRLSSKLVSIASPTCCVDVIYVSPFSLRIRSIIQGVLLDSPSLVQYQKEKQQTSRPEALLDERCHGTAAALVSQNAVFGILVLKMGRSSKTRPCIILASSYLPPLLNPVHADAEACQEAGEEAEDVC